MRAYGVEGASEISARPLLGAPPRFRIRGVWRNIHRKHHTIPISSFYALIVAYGAQLIFKGNFFVYRPMRAKLSGIFALPRPGVKWKKIGGGRPPLGGI